MKREIAISGLVLCLLLAGSAAAQRGTGERQGVARQAVKPAVQAIAGTLQEVKTGPCEQTTGKSPIGTHLILEGTDATYNLHLGPEAEVGDVIKLARVGKPVEATAFRTGRLADDHFVAVTVKLGGEEIRLRDESLRPRWAGGGRRGGGQALRGGGEPVGSGGGPRLVSSRVLAQSSQLQLSTDQVESIEAILADAQQRIREVLTEQQLQTLENQPRVGQGRRRGQR